MNVFDNVFIFLIICLSNSNRRSESSLDYVQSLTAGQPIRCHLSQVVAQLLYPTSDRNREAAREQSAPVVFLLYPTSNRNPIFNLQHWMGLYISFILHQTATASCLHPMPPCCISPLSYIKPQLNVKSFMVSVCCISPLSYIKPQPKFQKTLDINNLHLLTN